MALSPLYWALAKVSGLISTPVETVAPELARRQFVPGARGPAIVMGQVAPGITLRDDVIEGVPVRRYLPERPKGGRVIYFHGGGWVVGNLDSHDIPVSWLAAKSQREVIAVDYRLAPEHPFPAAYDDCAKVCLALAGESFVVAGDSAGGNLSAALASKVGAKAQLLIYPAVDLAAESPSFDRYAEGHVLRRKAVRYYIHSYVPVLDHRFDPRVSPIRRDSLKSEPPAYVLLAENDVLHDEGVAYFEKLKAAGVPSVLDDVPGVFHGFFNMQNLAAGRRALTRAAKWVDQQLSV